jgi:adenosylcobinamide-GDP ribazoletransferase
MTALLRTFLFAWQFLTAIPLSPSTHDAKPQELAASMSWYPFVGCLLGLLLATADMLLGQVFSSQVTNLLLMLLLIGITRGLHQDGLADMVDGLAGGRTAQVRLAIMRDSHIGAIGATGLFLMVMGAFHATYARSEGGLAQPFLAHLSWWHLGVATVTAGLVLALLLGPWLALCCLAIGTILVRLSTVWFHRMFGGVTGDVLGATNEVAEILFIVIVPVVFFR